MQKNKNKIEQQKMFNMLEIYRSRLFNRRMTVKAMLAKRASTFYRRNSNSNGSLNKIGQMSDGLNFSQMMSYGEAPESGKKQTYGTTGRRLSTSSSKASLNQEQAQANDPQLTSIQQTLSTEADRLEEVMKTLTLSDEEQLVNLLIEYFLSKEDVTMYSCSQLSDAADDSFFNSQYSIAQFSSSFEQMGLSRIKKFASMAEIKGGLTSNSSIGKRALNRCYYASIQAHMAQAFKSMDTNFDNKLSYDEFSAGIRNLLSENCVRRLCAKSYVKFVLNIISDEKVLRKLFSKFDINNDETIDFSKYFCKIIILMFKNLLLISYLRNNYSNDVNLAKSFTKN